MDPRERELRQLLDEKIKESRSLLEEGKMEEAKKAKDEARTLKEELETHIELRGLEPTEEPKDPTPQIDPKNEPEDRAKEDNETEYRSAFYNMLRGRALSSEEKRALSEGTASAGGYTVPKSFMKKLVEKLEEMNIMRKLASIIKTDSDVDLPVVVSHGSADWTAEEANFNESDETFGQITLKAYKLTRIIKVSEELLADSAFDLEGYLALEFARRLAKAEENAFINGDGVNKPAGVFIGAEVGVTAAAGTAITADEIIDLYYSLPRAYRQNATWITNDTTAKAIRKLKDSNGDYLWQKGLAGEPDTILGKPFYTSEFAPQIALSAKVLAFGDISFYQIADRKSRVFQRLNELYSANGQVGFRGYERVDGKLTVAEAVKVLQMAAV